MILQTAPYREAETGWPREGRHILAQHDEATVVVYQAYRPETGRYAARHGRFGPGFSFGRMSWIKPNFLWMMYRSQWGRSAGQEVTLAIVLTRAFFDSLLARAVPSAFDPALYPAREAWQAEVAASDVRLQWDPDHDPTGAPVPRRALQLGLRREALRGWDGATLVAVHDISEFVAAQRPHAVPPFDRLRVPVERPYPVADAGTRLRLGL